MTCAHLRRQGAQEDYRFSSDILMESFVIFFFVMLNTKPRDYRTPEGVVP